MMNPVVVESAFTEPQRADLLSYCDTFLLRARWDDKRHRLTFSPKPLNAWAEKLLPVARDIFNEDDLHVSYSCWALYESPASSLERHKDNNACTYTFDYCVRQDAPWGLYVEGQRYNLEPNQALAFLGEQQEHWRDDLGAGNRVEMIFFHFVRSDHWWFREPWRRGG